MTTTRWPGVFVEPPVDDVAAFGRIYDETSARVYGVVLRVVRDPVQAEEVTTEVYLELWRQAKRYDLDQGSAIAWVMTIAHRRAVNHVRSGGTSRRREQTDHSRCCRVGLGDDMTGTAERFADAEMVQDALLALPAKQRRAIELAYFSGCTHTEVARLLELPRGTAIDRISNALIRLRLAILAPAR